MMHRENEEGSLQVDSAQMEHIFSTLVDHLQIQEAYNIFILNPKPISKSINYGYRWVCKYFHHHVSFVTN